MTLPISWRRGGRRKRPLTSRQFGLLVLAGAAVLAAAACGGSGTTSSQTTPQTAQVLVTVTRGDLVQTVTARLELTKDGKDGADGAGQVAKASASSVSKGMSVKVFFIERPAGMGQSPGAMPSPSTGQGGQYPSPMPSAMPSGQPQGQGQMGNGAGPDLGGDGNLVGAKSVDATVTSVQTNSDGSVTIHVAMAELPSGVTTTFMAIARLSQQTLAEDVLLLPLAAVTISGDKATVKVISDGKSETRQVVVGKKTLQQVEIVSGLNEGENVIYERKFNGFPSINRGQRPSPGATGIPGGGAGV